MKTRRVRPYVRKAHVVAPIKSNEIVPLEPITQEQIEESSKRFDRRLDAVVQAANYIAATKRRGKSRRKDTSPVRMAA